MLEEENSCATLAERQQHISTVTKFIEEQKQRLSQILETLGLTSEKLLQGEEMQACPYNNNHIVPEKSFQKHIQTCKLLSAGYQRDELPALLQNTDFCYEDNDCTLKINIDENLLNKSIWDHCVQKGQVYTGHRSMPVSYIDENINLTQEDKLAIYQYVVKKSHEAGKVIPVDRNDDLLTTDWGSLVKKGLLDEQNNKQYASKLEQLAALRDMKRRRQSYRAKNVHITKKSYTEIIREVISNQMEILVPEGGSQETMTSLEDSKDKDRNVSKSYERHRDRDHSSSRDKYRKDYEDDNYHGARDRHRKRHDAGRRTRDTSYDRRKSRMESRGDNSDRSRSRLRSKSRDKNSSPQLTTTNKSRRITETDGLPIEKAAVENEYYNLPAAEGKGGTLESNDTTEELRSGRSSRKPSYTESDSDLSEIRHSKHKKSKHKKKHSKKHKRKN